MFSKLYLEWQMEEQVEKDIGRPFHMDSMNKGMDVKCVVGKNSEGFESMNQ
jgi:hypothetical protein